MIIIHIYIYITIVIKFVIELQFYFSIKIQFLFRFNLFQYRLIVKITNQTRVVLKELKYTPVIFIIINMCMTKS